MGLGLGPMVGMSTVKEASSTVGGFIDSDGAGSASGGVVSGVVTNNRSCIKTNGDKYYEYCTFASLCIVTRTSSSWLIILSPVTVY